MYEINRSARKLNFAGSLVRTMMSSEATRGVFSLQEFWSPSGRSTPRHMHDREEETISLLEGVLEVDIGDERITMKAGETLLIPRGTPHRLIMTGDAPARYLVLCTPGGFDEFVEACAEEGGASWPPESPSAEHIARLKEESGRFGITIFPPGG